MGQKSSPKCVCTPLHTYTQIHTHTHNDFLKDNTQGESDRTWMIFAEI